VAFSPTIDIIYNLARASRIKNKPVVNQHRSVEVLEALLKESERKNEEQVRHHQDCDSHCDSHAHSLSLSSCAPRPDSFSTCRPSWSG
jgi:hypothetical protein